MSLKILGNDCLVANGSTQGIQSLDAGPVLVSLLMDDFFLWVLQVKAL